MKHIASFSTGLSSAVMVERLLARYGRDDVEIVSMDTLIEDDDNYRFSNELLHGRWADVASVVLTAGRTPYEVSRAQHVIPNQKLAPCTRRLKIEPFTAYLATLTGPLTVHIGFDYSEVHRCAATDKNYNALGYATDYPLLWKPLEHRPYVQVAREDWGIVAPRMYYMGYTHANCGGRCVKQGKGDWLRTLANFPERYAEAEEWERRMRQNETNADYAFLRHQEAGVVRPMTLQELREQHEAGRAPTLFDLDAASACVVCGVGL